MHAGRARPVDAMQYKSHERNHTIQQATTFHQIFRIKHFINLWFNKMGATVITVLGLLLVILALTGPSSCQSLSCKADKNETDTTLYSVEVSKDSQHRGSSFHQFIAINIL